jgi:hypothetical protein
MMDETNSTVMQDGVTFVGTDLTKVARALLLWIQLVEAKLQQFQGEIALSQTTDNSCVWY